MTRKGSKQLTDDKRASQVASPTLAPDETDQKLLKDPATLTAAKRKSSAFWTPEIIQGAREVQEKRVNMTEEEKAIDIEKTRLILGMLPIEIVRDMKENDKQRKERDKQRGNPKRPSGNDGDAAVPDPFEIDNDTDDNDNDNDKRDDGFFSADNDDGNGDNDPDYDNDPDDDNSPDDDSDPDDEYTQSTDDEKTKKKNRSKRKTPQVPSGFPEILTGHA